MALPQLGFGLAPMGTSPFGFGQVATADGPSGTPFTKPDGSQGDARRINPLTRDYEIDSTTGLPLGEDGTQQLVYLALLTVKGSSVVSSLGQEFSSVKVVTQNTKARLEDLVRKALSQLIGDGLIELVEVDVEFTVSRQALMRVLWRDLTRSKTNIATVNL